MYYNTCPHCGAHLDPDERRPLGGEHANAVRMP